MRAAKCGQSKRPLYYSSYLANLLLIGVGGLTEDYPNANNLNVHFDEFVKKFPQLKQGLLELQKDRENVYTFHVNPNGHLRHVYDNFGALREIYRGKNHGDLTQRLPKRGKRLRVKCKLGALPISSKPALVSSMMPSDLMEGVRFEEECPQSKSWDLIESLWFIGQLGDEYYQPLFYNLCRDLTADLILGLLDESDPHLGSLTPYVLKWLGKVKEDIPLKERLNDISSVFVPLFRNLGKLLDEVIENPRCARRVAVKLFYEVLMHFIEFDDSFNPPSYKSLLPGSDDPMMSTFDLRFRSVPANSEEEDYLKSQSISIILALLGYRPTIYSRECWNAFHTKWFGKPPLRIGGAKDDVLVMKNCVRDLSTATKESCEAFRIANLSECSKLDLNLAQKVRCLFNVQNFGIPFISHSMLDQGCELSPLFANEGIFEFSNFYAELFKRGDFHVMLPQRGSPSPKHDHDPPPVTIPRVVAYDWADAFRIALPFAIPVPFTQKWNDAWEDGGIPSSQSLNFEFFYWLLDVLVDMGARSLETSAFDQDFDQFIQQAVHENREDYSINLFQEFLLYSHHSDKSRRRYSRAIKHLMEIINYNWATGLRTTPEIKERTSLITMMDYLLKSLDSILTTSEPEPHEIEYINLYLSYLIRDLNAFVRLGYKRYAQFKTREFTPHIELGTREMMMSRLPDFRQVVSKDRFQCSTSNTADIMY